MLVGILDLFWCPDCGGAPHQASDTRQLHSLSTPVKMYDRDVRYYDATKVGKSWVWVRATRSKTQERLLPFLLCPWLGKCMLRYLCLPFFSTSRLVLRHIGSCSHLDGISG